MRALYNTEPKMHSILEYTLLNFAAGQTSGEDVHWKQFVAMSYYDFFPTPTITNSVKYYTELNKSFTIDYPLTEHNKTLHTTVQ